MMNSQNKRLFRLAVFTLHVLLFVSGCTLKGSDPIQYPSLNLTRETHIPSVPFYAQDNFNCGPASLAMVLSWSGLNVIPEDLKSEVLVPKRKGSLQYGLKTASRRHGRLAYEISGMQQLLAEVDAGHPVIILQNLGLKWFPKWHYAVVVGYNLKKDLIFLHSGDRKNLNQVFHIFHNTWERSGYWGLLVLKPGDMPATARQKKYLQAVIGLEQAGKWQAAAQSYEAALLKWPQNLTAAIGRGNCLYHQDKFKKAELAYRKAIVNHPKNPEIYNNLAQVLMNMDRIKQAREAAQKAIHLGGVHRDVFNQTLNMIQSLQE